MVVAEQDMKKIFENWLCLEIVMHTYTPFPARFDEYNMIYFK